MPHAGRDAGNRPLRGRDPRGDRRARSRSAPRSTTSRSRRSSPRSSSATWSTPTPTSCSSPACWAACATGASRTAEPAVVEGAPPVPMMVRNWVIADRRRGRRPRRRPASPAIPAPGAAASTRTSSSRSSFSEPVSGVDARSFTLTDATGAPVPAAVDQIGPGTFGLFPHRVLLQPGATYTRARRRRGRRRRRQPHHGRAALDLHHRRGCGACNRQHGGVPRLLHPLAIGRAVSNHQAEVQICERKAPWPPLTSPSRRSVTLLLATAAVALTARHPRPRAGAGRRQRPHRSLPPAERRRPSERHPHGRRPRRRRGAGGVVPQHRQDHPDTVGPVHHRGPDRRQRPRRAAVGRRLRGGRRQQGEARGAAPA